MSVSYRELTGMSPNAFSASSKSMSLAADKLATEYAAQYEAKVLDPLQARRAWRGGGQYDAGVVAEVNGLAIDTMRLRSVAGAVCYLYAHVCLTVARAQLSNIERRLEADDLKLDADGNVSAKHVPVGDDNGFGSTSHTVQKYQRQIGKVLEFATSVDAQHILTSLETLPAEIDRRLPVDSGDLFDPSSIDVHIPPGSAGQTLGAGLFAAGLIAGGAIIQVTDGAYPRVTTTGDPKTVSSRLNGLSPRLRSAEDLYSRANKGAYRKASPEIVRKMPPDGFQPGEEWQPHQRGVRWKDHPLMRGDERGVGLR